MTIYTAEKVSKWTIAILADGIKIETAKSMKKALARIAELESEVKPTKKVKIKKITLKPKKKVTKPAKKGSSIKQRVIELMSAGTSNADVIEAIQEEFPKSAFKQSHATWYRARLIKDELLSTEFSARSLRAKLKANQKEG